MRTARLLTVSKHALGRGVSQHALPREGIYPGDVADPPPHPPTRGRYPLHHGQTDTCET